MTREHLLIFGSITLASWFLVTYFWPCMLMYVYKRAILVQGVGNGPIPINALQAVPQALFADPVGAAGSASKLATMGVNRDTLYVVGWLDLSKGSQVMHVPDMAGRYYSVQFTDPSKNTTFVYVGKRTTGTAAGDFLITGPGWNGQIPSGMKQISSQNNSVLVAGRVFVKNDSDLPNAHHLSTQIQLAPLRV
jgi:hypothetical protein